MSSEKKQGPEPEMREEYDFSNGVRGKYAERFAKGTFSTSTHPGTGGNNNTDGKLREEYYESL